MPNGLGFEVSQTGRKRMNESLVSNSSSVTCDKQVKLENIYKGKPASWYVFLFCPASANLVINQHTLNVYTPLSVAVVSAFVSYRP